MHSPQPDSTMRRWFLTQRRAVDLCRVRSSLCRR
ncbi:putative leader peptide [Amycolatopsis sp. YIM 10]